MLRSAIAAVMLTAVGLGGHAARLGAQDFRIETKVFVGDEAEPVSENLTLFRAGVVYDYLAQPVEIAVFRRSPTERDSRFILLDPDQRLRAEIRTERIRSILVDLKSWAASQSDPLLQFAANPQFQEYYDSRGGVLRLESDQMRYRLLTDTLKATAEATLYREFSDWYGRLAAVTHIGSLPPFPRLAANEALARHERIAREVQLTIPARRPSRNTDLVLRAQHHVQWRLSKKDRQRLDETDRYLVAFRSVSFDEFQARRK